MRRWLSLVFLLGLAPAAGAQKHEDLSGRYMIDLPAGWSSQDLGSNTMNFKGSGYESIQLGFIEGQTDRSALCQVGEGVIKQNLTGAAPEGDIVDLEVNGNPGRWGVYRGTVQAGGQAVPLFGLVGCVVLAQSAGGVFFVSILNQGSRQQLGPAIQKAFESIRPVSGAFTGVQNRRPVAAAAGGTTGPAVAAAATPFTHELVSLTLPPGWTVQPKSNNPDPDMIATLSSQELGANLIVAGGRKYGNLNQITQKGRNTIQVAIPNAQPAGEPFEVTTQSGEKVRMQLFTGSLVVNGKDIPMGALLAATKNDARGLVFMTFYGTTVASNGERVGREVGLILSSIR